MTKAPIAVASLVLLAAACTGRSDAAFVERCEKLVTAQVRTPATYQRHSVNADEKGNVMLYFDSQNAYGAVIRSEAACRFTDGDLEFAIVDGAFVRESLLALY